MTPEQLKDIRDRLAAVEPWGSINWRLRPEASHGAVWGVIRGEPVHPYPDIATDPEHALWFVQDAAINVGSLLSHVDALQARLDAAEAERDQLRAIFACDLLEDSEALRLAYERGKADATAKHIFTDASNSPDVPLQECSGPIDDDEDFDEFNEGLWDDTSTGTTEAASLPPGVHVGTADVLHDGTGDMIEFVRDAAMRAMGLPGSVFQGEPTFPPVTLEAKKLLLQTQVTDELLRDAGGTP